MPGLNKYEESEFDPANGCDVIADAWDESVFTVARLAAV